MDNPAKKDIEHRLTYERSLSSAIIRLNTNDDNAVTKALGHILSCSEASRIYIFHNFIDENNLLSMRQVFEVCADNIEPQIGNEKLQHVVYGKDGFGRWQERLSEGESIYGRVADFPEEERTILEAQGIKSILIIPIFARGDWYGFIGFDDVVEGREWSMDDILLLQTFSRMLGNFFEREEAEQKLRSKKEQFELAVRGSNDGIWDWDLKTNDLYLSERWKEMLGYTDDELENSFDTFTTLLHKDDKERVLRYVNEYLKGKHDKYDAEFRLRHKDGRYRWIRARGEALFGADGKPYRMAGSHSDLTEKIESERMLREREAQFRTIFHNSPQPMALTALENGKIIEANDTFCKKLNISKEYILGRTTTELNFYSPASREKFTNELREHGRVDGLVMDFNSPEGPNLTAKMFASFITVNDQKYILTIFDDITEQQQMENALRTSEEKFRSFVENANDIVYALSKDAVFTYVSPNWKDILGHDPAEVLGKRIVRFVHPDDLDRCAQFLGRVLETGEKQEGIEYRVRHINDEWRWHMSNASPLKDEKGKVTCYIGIARDITERKKVEDELVKAKEAAVSANKAKSEFLANMSHEIRTPLNAVIGFSQLLQDTPLSHIQEQYVDNVNSSAQALLGIINDILDFSKIEAGKLELELIKTDMYELLEQSIDIINYAAAKKNLEVLLDIDPHTPRFAVVDPVRLKQILANLLSNAVKFTDAGEIELKVGFEQMKKSTGTFHFSVRDTGIGITEQQTRKLFKAFSQADSSTTRKFGGTGLGLIISENIAGKMGSKLNLESTPGEGSIFSFSFETKIEYGEKLIMGKIEDIDRCLIIDDNENNRKILEHMLDAWDIACTSCENGFESLEIIERNKPFDVIICDYHMPYLDGLETIKMIREKLELPPEKQPIILLHSSSDDAQLVMQCKDLGVRWRLTKPVKQKELYTKLLDLYSNDPDEMAVKEEGQKEVKPRFQGNTTITILIAEDNALNMILAKSIVSAGIPSARIIETVNGKQAVEQAVREKPDIVFMDVQMPELDGNDATREIRKHEKDKKLTPARIIGLTAGATKEEKEKSLRAGMDDFITKPINIEKLRQIIQGYLRQDTNEASNEMSEHFDKKTFTAAVDDLDLVAEIIQHVREDIPRKLFSLEDAINENTAAEAAKLAHTIKGMALNLHCNLFASMAQQLEQSIKNENIKEAKKTLEKIKEEWDILAPLLKCD
jgi:PAS domain S-box-containing protein